MHLHFRNCLFKPIKDIPLFILTYNVVFFVAITFVKRVFELAALPCKKSFIFPCLYTVQGNVEA